MNQPSGTFYNDDDAVLTTLRNGHDREERRTTYRHFRAALAEDYLNADDPADLFPRAWGVFVTWIKEQGERLPLRRPLATYLLGFLAAIRGGDTGPAKPYRYRYACKRALVELAPTSANCRESIARCFAESCSRILDTLFPRVEADPEEVYGEAITDLFANLPRRREPETATLFTYFMTIARRKYSRHLNRQKKQPRPAPREEDWEATLRKHDRGYTEEPSDFADVLAECRSEVARSFVFNDEGELVRQLLRLLPANYREAVELRFLQELDYAQIAARIGSTPENARARVHRALGKLRELLNRKP